VILLHQSRIFSVDICMARSSAIKGQRNLRKWVAVVKERYLQALVRAQ
jgi:hypothetical protein